MSCQKSNHHGGDENLVHHLGVLTAAGTSHVLDVGSHALCVNCDSQPHLEQGNQIIVHILITAHHDAELSIASTNVTSGHGSIEAVEALRLRDRVDFLSKRRLAGGHIHVDTALLRINPKRSAEP